MKSVESIPILKNIPVLLRTSQAVNEVRLREALPTIEYLQKHHARVILATHVSGTGTETAKPMYEALKRFIQSIAWCPVSVGPAARQAVRDIPPGGVLMLENLRRNKGEEKNDPAFAAELAELADVFVEDAFDTCHREHASIVSVPTLLPSYAGFTLLKEIAELSKALEPKSPSLAIIGGAKFSTKEPVISRLLTLYDHVFVGGAIANDFIQAAGNPVGASAVSGGDPQAIDAMRLNQKLVLPIDARVAPLGSKRNVAREALLSDVHDTEAILDAGPKTVASLETLVQQASFVLWNGPLGNFENGFTDATAALATAIARSSAYSVVGGGDTIAAIEEQKANEHFSFISTGGGAMLDFLAYGTLPGIAVLEKSPGQA